MLTLYEMMKKFPYDKFDLCNRRGDVKAKNIDSFDLENAIEYDETAEEKRLIALSEIAVVKIDFEQMNIYLDI